MSEKIIRVEHLQQFFPVGGFGKNKKYVREVDLYLDSMSLQMVELYIRIKFCLTAGKYLL